MTTRFTVRLPDELNTLLEESAARTGVSKNSVIILGLRCLLLPEADQSDWLRWPEDKEKFDEINQGIWESGD